jgi:hypothetical protein
VFTNPCRVPIAGELDQISASPTIHCSLRRRKYRHQSHRIDPQGPRISGLGLGPRNTKACVSTFPAHFTSETPALPKAQTNMIRSMTIIWPSVRRCDVHAKWHRCEDDNRVRFLLKRRQQARQRAFHRGGNFPSLARHDHLASRARKAVPTRIAAAIQEQFERQLRQLDELALGCFEPSRRSR